VWLVAEVARALTPIGDELRRQITAASYLQTDDTPVTILEETGSRKGRIWTYLDPLVPQVVFDATRTHERDGPEAFLTAFGGDLQADAYTGYDALYQTGRIRELGCWAHARRGFVEALPTDARAARMIELVQQLYQVERAAVEDAVDARRGRRQEHSVPVLDAIRVERDALAATVLPKSPLGEAVRYLTNQWDALQRFTEERRPDPRCHASTAPDWSAHADGLGRDLRATRRRLSAARDSLRRSSRTRATSRRSSSTLTFQRRLLPLILIIRLGQLSHLLHQRQAQRP
jgi:hypothetical protein